MGSRNDLERTSNVVDIGNVMEFIRVFREAFDPQPLSVQAEILRHRIRKMVVREGGVFVEVFGGKSDSLVDLATRFVRWVASSTEMVFSSKRVIAVSVTLARR